MAIYRPGSVKIHGMRLWSQDKSRSVDNIGGLVKNIKIYESITDPVMTAVFTVFDGIGLRETFPIIGEEYIEIDLETPGMDEIFSYKFTVNSISPVGSDLGDKGSAYNLMCTTEDFRKNLKVVNEIFKEANPSDVIQMILTDYIGTEKEFIAGEGVIAKVDLDLTQNKVFQAIDKARLLTRNIQEQSSAYCFFENKYGYNFFSIEQMFETGKTKIGDKIFFFDQTGGHSIYENNFRNIIGFTKLTEFNPVAAGMAGQLNAKMKSFDLITGEVIEKQYEDAKSSAGFIYADDEAAPLRSSSGSNEDASEPAQYLMNVIDSSKYDPQVNEMQMERASYVHKLIQQIFRIEIFGDLAMSVGDVIEVNIPTSKSLTDKTENKTDPRFSGNFLVSKLVHNISLAGGSAVHSTTCELIKGNLNGA